MQNNKMTLNSVYKFYVEGELSENEFKNILKERGYTVIIEGASRYKYGVLKGVIYTSAVFVIAILIHYIFTLIKG